MSGHWLRKQQAEIPIGYHAKLSWRIRYARSPQVAWKVKWLSEKSDCLTVRFVEGYCRDSTPHQRHPRQKPRNLRRFSHATSRVMDDADQDSSRCRC